MVTTPDTDPTGTMRASQLLQLLLSETRCALTTGCPPAADIRETPKGFDYLCPLYQRIARFLIHPVAVLRCSTLRLESDFGVQSSTHLLSSRY